MDLGHLTDQDLRDPLLRAMSCNFEAREAFLRVHAVVCRCIAGEISPERMVQLITIYANEAASSAQGTHELLQISLEMVSGKESSDDPDEGQDTEVILQ